MFNSIGAAEPLNITEVITSLVGVGPIGTFLLGAGFFLYGSKKGWWYSAGEMKAERERCLEIQKAAEQLQKELRDQLAFWKNCTHEFQEVALGLQRDNKRMMNVAAEATDTAQATVQTVSRRKSQ